MEMTLIHIFDYVEKSERSAELLYRFFARRFAENGPLAITFSKLADQEKAHCDIIRFQTRIIRKTDEQFKKIDFDISAVSQILEEMSKAMGNDQITLEEARSLSERLEHSIVERYRLLIRPELGKEMQDLISGIIDDDNAHIRLIEQLSEEQSS